MRAAALSRRLCSAHPADAGTGWPIRQALIALLLLVGFAGHAQAQLIDQIDVIARESEAEISIRLNTTVQYLRHQPAKQGNLLQVEFQLTGDLDGGTRSLISETRRSPKTSLVPPFEVRYDSRNRYLVVKFSRFTSFAVRQGSDNRTISVFVPAAKKPGAAAPVVKPAKTLPAVPDPVPATAAAESQAETLMQQARQALAAKNAATAIDILNRLLNLPPNRHTPEAQALAGEARAMNGEGQKARAEYDLYLKLYPDGADADRVRRNLAALSMPGATPGKAAGEDRVERSFYGSVSSYYYSGSTKFDATLAPPQPGLTFSQISLTSTDQSALIASVDLNGRFRSSTFDNRIVVRDTETFNFLKGQKNTHRLNNAYVETYQKGIDLFARLGRQSSPGYGVLGRFDGAWIRYGTSAKSKLNLIAGVPVEFYPVPKKSFFGGAFDLGPFADSWSGNVFLVEQRVDGSTDRRGTGAELRYIDAKRNAFLLVDHDIAFKSNDIVLAQANWILDGGTNLNLLYDRRRSPVLQLTNGLPALPLPTISDNLASGLRLFDIRQAAKALTPMSTLLSFGATHTLSPAWQLGADVKMSEVSATEATGLLPAQPGTGKVYVYGMQAVRTGLFSLNDILVGSVNLIRGKSYDARSIQLSHVILIRDKWRIESTLRHYHQTDLLDVTLDRLAPTLRLSYRWNEHFSLESELGAEQTRTSGPMQQEKTTRRFYNVGARYDFY